MSSSLLSLPRELRDEIIDYVIQSRRPAPGKPDRDVSSTEAGRVRFDDVGMWSTSSRFNGDVTYFESSPEAFEPTFSNLLRTCHQLRTETLERQATVQIPCVLDMLIVNGKDLWATWLSMPLQRSFVIERLKINVRVSGALRDSEPERDLALNSDHFSYLAQRLIMRILSRGTSGPMPGEKWEDAFTRTDDKRFFHSHWEFYYTPHYCIRALDIDFSNEVLKDVDEIVASPHSDFEELRSSRTEDEPFYIEHPDDYRGTLHYVLASFFHHKGPDIYAPHQRALRERVGSVTLSYAGAVKTDWSRLSEAFEDSGNVRIGHWSENMRQIVEARKRNGIHETNRKQTGKSNLI